MSLGSIACIYNTAIFYVVVFILTDKKNRQEPVKTTCSSQVDIKVKKVYSSKQSRVKIQKISEREAGLTDRDQAEVQTGRVRNQLINAGKLSVLQRLAAG